jgi:hypothetical protein
MRKAKPSDIIPPVVTLTSMNSGQYQGGSVQTITWTATDNIALAPTPIRIDYATDGGTVWTAVTGYIAHSGTYSWTLPLADSTTVRVRVRASDTSGNVGQAVSSSNFIVDSTGPAATAAQMAIVQGASVTNKYITINFKATDNLTNVSHFCFKYVNSPPSSTSACWKAVDTDAGLTLATSLTLTAWPHDIGEYDGAYTVYGWTRDAVGNISSLTNSGAGTLAQDKASTTQTFSCPYTLPGSVSVAHAYTNFTNWNDYVTRDQASAKPWAQTDTSGNACAGVGSAQTNWNDCIHAGVIKKVAVTGISSCYGLTATDWLGVYKWTCDDSSGTATFYSSDFQPGRGLRNLLNPTSWKSNEVTVACGAQSASSSGSTWYSNTVTPLPDNSTLGVSTLIILDGTDNDGAGPDQVYTAGTVFTLAASRASYGYNLRLTKAAIVTLPGATLSFLADDVDSDGVADLGNDGSNYPDNVTLPLSSCGINCSITSLIAVGDRKYTWFEGDFDSGSVAPTRVFHSGGGGFRRLHNSTITSTRSSGYGIFHAVGSLLMIDDTKVHCKGASAGTITGAYFSGSRSVVVKDVSSGGCGVGLSVATNDAVLHNVQLSASSIGAGFSNSGNHIATQVTSFSSSNYGINTSNQTSTTLSFLTVANSAFGLYIGGSSSAVPKNVFINQVGLINNAHGLYYTGTSTTVAQNAFIHSTTASIELLGTVTAITHLNNIYTNANCINSSSGTGNNIPSGTAACAKNDGSQAFGTSSASITSSYSGMISAADQTNGSSVASDGTRAFASVTDRVNFENRWRGFGKDSASALYNTNQQGPCTSGTCHVWDWTLASADSVLRNKSGDGITTNGTFEDAENCPAQIHGNQSSTDLSATSHTFLTNAIEVMSDGLGNDNGLCESNETCIYAPNFASAYQGAGDYTKHKCVFNAGTITGVTMYAYPADAPTAINDTITVPYRTETDLDVLANDVEGALVDSIISAPTGGTVKIINGKVRYTPYSLFTGNDSFTYKMRSSNGSLSNTATVNITVSMCIRDQTTNSPYATLLGSTDGTVADPILICTPAQMASLANTSADWSKSFILGANIDLTGYTQANFPTIGNGTTKYRGKFYGNGKTVSNFSFNNGAQDKVGLFGMISGSAAGVYRLTMTGAAVVGGNEVGVLVGDLDLGAEVLDCSTAGSVQGAGGVGGLAGMVEHGSVVDSSRSSAAVTSTGATIWHNAAGGLVGSLWYSGVIMSSYATGNVTATTATAGGAVAGGLAGDIANASILDSYYAGGTVSETATASTAGGIVGKCQGYSRLYNVFGAAGSVLGNASGTDTIGLFFGTQGNCQISNSHRWTGGTCTNSGGGGGTCNTLGTAQATLSNFYNPANAPLSAWDFTRTWVSNNPSGLPSLSPVWADLNAWGSCASHTSDAPFAGGNGTPEDPYLICTPTQFAELMNTSTYWTHKAFRLMANIDTSSLTRQPIGFGSSLDFVSVDGNGKAISGFSYTGGAGIGSIGLFGSASSSVIKRLAATGLSISASGQFIGGMIGSSALTSVVDSYTTGTISTSLTGSSNYIGGLVGHQGGGNEGIVGTSYSTMTVTGADMYVQGLSDGCLLDPPWYNCPHNFFAGSVTGAAAAPGNYSISPLGYSNMDSSYYSSASSCTNTGSGGACGSFGSGSVTATDLYDKTKAPISNWDFVNVWQENAGAFPTLR